MGRPSANDLQRMMTINAEFSFKHFSPFKQRFPVFLFVCAGVCIPWFCYSLSFNSVQISIECRHPLNAKIQNIGQLSHAITVIIAFAFTSANNNASVCCGTSKFLTAKCEWAFRSFYTGVRCHICAFDLTIFGPHILHMCSGHQRQHSQYEPKRSNSTPSNLV